MGAGKAAGHGGCSPRVRGWSRLGRVVRALRVVLPACAGVVPTTPCPCWAWRSAPCVCGGGPVWS
ncbi:hypothetical protein C0R03_12005 [Streptomyces albidoflavus]|nr:hypothetical protein C0R03_12005 [Streptomyces albidoflavus]